MLDVIAVNCPISRVLREKWGTVQRSNRVHLLTD
jgi:hypothetical protein